MLRLVTLLAAICLGQASIAQENRGTLEEAVAMVVDALSLFEESGPDALFAAISNENSDRFGDRDLFPIVWDVNGVMLVHGRNSPAMGANRYDTTDVNGFHHSCALIEVAMGEGTGWVPYRFADPLTGQDADMVTYVLALNEELLPGVGIYTDQ